MGVCADRTENAFQQCIIAYVCVAAEACLASRSLPTIISSGSTILVSRGCVTVCSPPCMSRQASSLPSFTILFTRTPWTGDSPTAKTLPAQDNTTFHEARWIRTHDPSVWANELDCAIVIDRQSLESDCHLRGAVLSIASKVLTREFPSTQEQAKKRNVPRIQCCLLCLWGAAILPSVQWWAAGWTAEK
jgi:hypothetical protein